MRPVPVFALLLAPALVAQQPDRRPLTREDLEPFLDGLITAELTRSNIAGAVVSVVQGGQVLLARGYGWADVARRIRPSPDTTLFRVASISKTFNATAVMQLVEQGRLDLDADVQQYLDFELPKTFPEPITLRHLLTHTAGFEESGKQLAADSGQSVELAEFMKGTTPRQMYRVGTVTAYSNYGADLAGYIVERVSGLPFEEYIRQRILEPLGMRYSSFAEPLPPDLKPLVSREYATASDSAAEFEIIQGEPSGNLSSTAADMARFMTAHLNRGEAGGVRILADSTARYMATTQFRTHPAVNGMAVGFFEESRDGYRMIGHGGDLSRFHSHMLLLLDEGVGLFLSLNSSGSGSGLFGMREAVIDAFMHRYFPRQAPLEPLVTGDEATAAARRVTGSYQLSRRAESTLFKAVSLAIDLKVTANDDGSIQIPFLTGVNGRPIRWYPIGDLVYRTEDGSQRLGFVTDERGRVTRIAFIGGHELHRVGLADHVGLNRLLAGGSLGVMAATLLLWPVAAIVRRRYGQSAPADGLSRGLRLATRATPLVALGLVVGFAVFFGAAVSGQLKLDPSVDPYLRLFQVLGALVLAGTAATVLAAIRSLRQGTSGLAKVKYVALAGSCLAFSWFILHWNILTTNLDF